MILAGVSERLYTQLESTGVLDELGRENVLRETDIVFKSTDAALELGRSWLAETDSAEPTSAQ